MSFLIRSLVLAVLLPAVVIQSNDLFPGLRGHREWRRCLNSLRIMKIKRAIFLLEQATAAAIELRIVTPLKTCAHVLLRMMDMVSIKRGLPFHRCANGFLTNKIGQSLRLHKKEWVKHFTQLSEHTAARSWQFVYFMVFGYSDLSRSGAQFTKINK